MYSTKAMIFGKAIYRWLSEFAPTYRGVLPAGLTPAEDLYIRFSGSYDDFARPFIFPIYIYNNRTTSYAKIIELADKIGEDIGENGLLIKEEGIRIKVDRGSPFYQDMPDEDETTRAGYVNIEVTIY